MKFVIQRAAKASVSVDEQVVGSIRQGYLVLIGVCDTDTEAEADRLVRKMLNLRISGSRNGMKTAMCLRTLDYLPKIYLATRYSSVRPRPHFMRPAASPSA